MKLNEIKVVLNTADKNKEIDEWFRKNSVFHSRSNILWNTYDKAIHLSGDFTINELDVNSPYDFFMCPKDFEIDNSGITELCFHKKAIVFGTLTLNNMPNLNDPKKFPSFTNSLKIRNCAGLKKLRLPRIGEKLEIIKCLNLTKVSDIPSVKTAKFSTCGFSKLPTFEDVSKLDELWIHECNKLDFSKIDQELTGLTWLLIGPTKTSSLTNIHKICPNLRSLQLLSTDSVKSNVLGLLKLKDLTEITMGSGSAVPPWAEIVNKYLPLGNALDCIDELEDAGFGEYAEL